MTEPTTLFLCVPLPPNRANARSPGSWRKHNDEKRAFWKRLDAIKGGATLFNFSTRKAPVARTDYVIPSPPATPWTAAVVAVTYYHTHEMDLDNSVSRCKPLMDWLVAHGYVVDDNKRALQWSGFPRQVKCKRSEVRVEVTLTRREPAREAA